MRTIALTSAALFLDIDGTLAKFAANPLDVGPEESRTRLLRRMTPAIEERIAVISGRPIADIDRILEGALRCVAGSHGLQRRAADGAVRLAKPHPALPKAVEALAETAEDYPGALLEMKPLSVALHYRRVPTAGRAILDIGRRVAGETGLAFLEGDQVIELLTPGHNKGAAVSEYMSEAPFAGATPIFVGDDITDESAFAAVRDLGGAGVIVGARRETLATARLAGVDHVLAWLDESLARGAFQLESVA